MSNVMNDRYGNKIIIMNRREMLGEKLLFSLGEDKLLLNQLFLQKGRTLKKNGFLIFFDKAFILEFIIHWKKYDDYLFVQLFSIRSTFVEIR